jgi:ParB family chromosome partitioning protein
VAEQNGLSRSTPTGSMISPSSSSLPVAHTVCEGGLMDEPGIVSSWCRSRRLRFLNPRGRGRRGASRDSSTTSRPSGLKRPITVSRRKLADGERAVRPDLRRGPHRSLSSAGREPNPGDRSSTCRKRTVSSAAWSENVARPLHRGVDLMREVGALRKRGYSDAECRQKIGRDAQLGVADCGALGEG